MTGLPWFEIILAFLGGLLIGSFLNVCIFRLPRDLSVVRPRSFCPGCVEAAEEKGMEFDKALAAGTLAPIDLVPVFSYLLLGGKCRRCKTPISWRYPLVELLTGALFAASVALFGPSPVAIKYILFSSIMITLIFTDLETFILPDEFTLGGVLVGLVTAWFVPMPVDIVQFLLPYDWSASLKSVCAAAIGGAMNAGLIWGMGAFWKRFRGREAMGLGDVKMIACVGTFLGFSSTLLTIMFASLLGSIFGVPGGVVNAFKRQRMLKARYDRLRSKNAVLRFAAEHSGRMIYVLTGRYVSRHLLPFGVFIGIAALLAAVYGELAMPKS